MSTVSLKFGGKLIEELSQKIPSSLFALNELIKNAYDAFSPDITITISPSKSVITITDKGVGMSEEEIASLFHLSKSTKNYGHEVTYNEITRITQGSKGLGFLSAFKFGDTVKWTTYKNGKCSIFSVKKSDLVNQDDISGVQIPVTTNECNETQRGTEITISASQYEMKQLLADLSDSKIAEKLVAAITDKSFNINLTIEDKNIYFSTNKLKPLGSEEKNSQLFYVEYSSIKEEINFYHLGELVKTFPFATSFVDYSIELNLIIFSFDNKSKYSKKLISNLYKREYDDALYPLVYINRNLFNNTIIFNPDLLRKQKSSFSLPQMIGNIFIRSQSEHLEFNSDRTNFVDNYLTRDLKKTLESLNYFIQKNGSEIKKTLKCEKKQPITGGACPTPPSDTTKITPASIYIDRTKKNKFSVPSEQINLENYIFNAKDSIGSNIDKSNIDIYINDIKSCNNIIESIEEPCELKISFKYNDSFTGLVSVETSLFFEKQLSNISGRASDDSLFKIQSGSDYQISIETVSDIINAIDKAYSMKEKDQYLPLIACSIRSIFEISKDKVIKTHKKLFKNINNKNTSLNSKVHSDILLRDSVYIIYLVKKNSKLRTRISENLNMNYSILTNLLDIHGLKVAIKNSHVGAHHSTKFLSKPKIQACADACGYFAVICDILIKMDEKDINQLIIDKFNESEFNSYFDS
ncbi:ATP-binding protein [Providencia rettgeri]|uniref:ATP-binding protein n=1 Tax=Providencia rettgeri TaxID=587 RepID=UPI00235DDF81|nr:ATP-binding protein [Providencia rettgeri]